MEDRTIFSSHLTAMNPETGKEVPAGGRTTGVGIDITWQDGPLKDNPRNGAFVEGVIVAAIQRLEFYQNSCERRFNCRENALAITKLEEALHWLDHRTKARQLRNVEGTHTP